MNILAFCNSFKSYFLTIVNANQILARKLTFKIIIFSKISKFLLKSNIQKLKEKEKNKNGKGSQMWSIESKVEYEGLDGWNKNQLFKKE